MKNIIVFGATGNIGIYFIDFCLHNIDRNQFNIIAVGRKKTDYFEKNDIEYYTIDICNKDDFNQLPTKNIYAVVNLAGILPAYLNRYNPYAYIETNIIGSLNILEYSRINKVNRILYTQSWSDLAGYLGKESVLTSDMPRKLKYTGDHAFYSITKCMIIDTLEYYKQEYGINNYIFRLPNIYLYNPEKYYYVNGERKLISYRYLIEKASKGEDIELWGNPNSFKDIIYIKDLCQIMYLALLSNVGGGMYNVGTGIKTTLFEQITGIIDVFSPKEKKSKIIYKPEKESFDSFVMDISKLKRDFNYSPCYKYYDYLIDYKKESELKRFDSLWK